MLTCKIGAVALSNLYAIYCFINEKLTQYIVVFTLSVAELIAIILLSSSSFQLFI